MVAKRRDALSRWWMYLIMVVVIGAVVEAASYGVVTYLSGRGLFFYAPDKASVDYDRYMRVRNPDTGWPFQTDTAGADETGARISPADKDLPGAAPCLSVYGDSFAWSTGVDDEHAWPNLLARKLGRPVRNFGVIGYGTDQALLRFATNPHDDAPVALLCFWTEDILRNVNQFRALLSPRAETLLKPRFVLSGGALQDIPLPTFTKEAFFAMLESPGGFLEHEYFLPDTHRFTIRARFPYTLSALKAVTSVRMTSLIQGEPFYEAFFQPEHDSNAYAVTLAILRRFARECAARGKTPVVAFIPGCRDIRQRQAKGAWVYDSLIEELKKDRIATMNTGEIFLQAIDGKDPCDLFRDVTLHYNEAGYALLAESVYDHLVAGGLAPETPRPGDAAGVGR